MSNYTITTDFGAKDDLPSGNAAKVIKGSEFSDEFTNIKTAVNSKADSVSPTFTGNTALNGTTTFGPDGTSTFNGTVNFTKDVTFDTNTMFVDVSENRVGIGTTSPAGNLHISAGTSGDATLILEADTDNSEEADNPKLQLRQDGNGVQGEMYMEGESGATASGSVANSLLLEARNSEGTNHIQFVTGGSNTTSTNGNVRMTIKNDGNVGIGTTNPATSLHVLNASDTQIRLSQTGEGSYDLGVVDGDKFAINRDGLTNEFVMSAGRVGIGTDNPATALTVAGSYANGIELDRNGADNTQSCRLFFDSTTNGYSIFNNGGALAFCTGAVPNSTSGTEKVRIDSSGNLLVGKPTNSVDVAGALIRASGKISACVEGDYAGIFHRKTSSGDDADGAIVHFRKDNVTVGSIGTNDVNYLYVGNGDTNLAFSSPNDLIFPRGSQGIQRDGLIDLGNGSNRFRNMWLSGGVHLGGTAEANRLHDYEEGDWEAGIRDNSANVSSTINQSCRYVKVGDMVTVTGQLVDINKGSLSTTLQVFGLPWTIKTGSTKPHGSIQLNNFNTGLADKGVFIQGQSGQTYFTIKANQNNAGAGTITGNTLASDNSSDIFFSLTYIVN